MAAKKTPDQIKKQRKNMSPCHQFDFKKKRQYLHYADGRRVWVKVGDPQYKDWPNIK